MGGQGAGSSTLSLDSKTIALIRVATAIAKGPDAALQDRMRAARGAAVPAAWIEELLLQSLLNVGYPLALAAFAVWREVAGPARDTGETIAHGVWAQWQRRGAEACRAVYGRTY